MANAAQWVELTGQLIDGGELVITINNREIGLSNMAMCGDGTNDEVLEIEIKMPD